MTENFKLTAIGNAIVDILAHTDEEFLITEEKNGMQRGSMTLIDAARATILYPLMRNPIEMSGGSAANTMACFSALGGHGAYIGKVAPDRFGKIFANDMHKHNIHFNTKPLDNYETPTAQCLIFVEPNAQRTMNTYLGASVLFAPDDVAEDIISQSEITYLEGYLFDKELAKQAFFKAAEFVKKHNRKLALTLSDTFCVMRHRDDFKLLIQNHVDILFANIHEILELYQTDDLNIAIDAVKHQCEIIAITRGDEGSLIVTADQIIPINAFPVNKVIDTTGAGDAYAAGFLYGITHGKTLEQAGNLGSRVAAEIISQMGPRPQKQFDDLLQTAA